MSTLPESDRKKSCTGFLVKYDFSGLIQCHKSLRVELISQNQLIKIHAQSKSSLFLKGDHGVEHNHVITLNLTLFIIPSGSALPAGLAVFKKSEFPLDVAC